MENIEQLREELSDLRFQVTALQQKAKHVMKDADNKIVAITARYEIGNMLNAYNTAFNNLPADAKSEAIKTLIDAELRHQNADYCA